MRVLRFQIRHNTGQVETITVEAERALVGSGAHCEIRLPLDQARVEHIIVEAAAAGVFVRALSFEPPPTINNIPFQQSPLPPSAVLGVTATQIYVELAETLGEGKQVTKKNQTSPLSLVAAALMIPAAFFLLFDDDEGKTKAPPIGSPELWSPAVATCPYTGPQALAFARERMAIADATRERRPFHVQDGVQAVPVYEIAAVCFRAGGDPPSGGLADESAKFLRHEINDDFRTRRVRLEHALSVQDYASAQKEVRVLLQLTEGKSGEYREWLSELNRTLRLKAGSKS